MPRIALATCADYPHLYFDEHLLFYELAAHGFTVEWPLWNDPQVDWSRYDIVLPRTTWDYYRVEDLQAILAWVAQLERSGVQLWNPPEVLRWNYDKRYLLDLERRGTRIVPTRYYEPSTTLDLAAEAAKLGTEEVIIKPSVSGAAWQMERFPVTQAAAYQPHAEQILRRCGLLLQPYLPEITRNGEWALMFFGGEFSHAVLKRAKPGDFRVQTDHGGTVHELTPPPEVLAAALHAVRSAPGPSIYARVDGVEVNGKFTLMEFEVFEPELFFRNHPLAARRFTEALLGMVRA